MKKTLKFEKNIKCVGCENEPVIILVDMIKDGGSAVLCSKHLKMFCEKTLVKFKSI